MTRKRLLLLYVLPTVVLLLAAVWPLVRGQETLYLRDTFNTHLEMKWFQAQAMRQGGLPLIDPLRSGGQPHVGNPNTLPLYPSNLLYLVAPTFWAFNAHFWLHLLIAPFTGYWLGRAWGLGREGAWATGVSYATSGYFLSTLNLYNLVAGVTWAPALAAGLLTLGGADDPRRRGWALAATGTAWALLLLGGDPMTAAAAVAVGLGALAARDGVRAAVRLPVVGALGAGTLLATPQLVEFLRILPSSFRGHWGFSEKAAAVGSWNPVQVIEWFLPFAFGKPDLAFWGKRFFDGEVPLLYTLFPGLLALALVAASGRPRTRAAAWAWAAIGLGLFLALGRFNPLFGFLVGLPGGGLLRLPVKLWLLVALGGSLLCGFGFERLRRGGGRPGRLMAAFFLIYFVAWLVLVLKRPAAVAWLGRLMPDGMAADLAPVELLRWTGLCLLSFLLVALYALAWRLGRGGAVAGGLLLALHVGAQLFFLRPVVPTDRIEPYRQPSPLLELVPSGARVVHGQANSLFGPNQLPFDSYPDARSLWLQRQVFAELYPVAGILSGRRYEMVTSPEGLDSFLTRAVTQAVKRLPDAARLRLLAASGVEYLLLARDLDPVTADAVELVGRRASPSGEIRVYRLRDPAPPVALTGRVRRSAHLNEALEHLTDARFDPRSEAVLPGEGPDSDGAVGEVEIVDSAPETLHLRVRSPDGGALVAQRTYLPVYRATLDGEPVAVQVANLHRIGIEVPAGEHQVHLWIDRRPFRLALLVSLLALAALAWLVHRERSRPPT